MKAVIVYESMYGNTHHVASAISAGLAPSAEVVVVPVHEADSELLASADLLVVGGPTHVHGMSSGKTRAAAADAAAKPGSDLELEPDSEGPGLRDWFAGLDRINTRAAAFDTRMSGPPALTGRASKGITRKLRHHGATVVADPHSFLVTKDNHLADDQQQQAEAWGAQLGALVSEITTTPNAR